jgi:energy-coupling factor transporter ATP-binding protein EcfA2
MLNRIEVRHYQSLHHADIPLGWFTVITGPTGSGKSALFRAVLMLARNARGTSYVSHGHTSCSVSAGGDGGAPWGRGWVARLTRSSARTGKNEYRVAQEVPVPTGGYGWSGCTYTKLGGQVPPRVEDLLRLSDLNFARQLPQVPFLVTLPGTEIARRLGDLTNVSLVLGAAAEAGRLRKAAQRDLDAAQQRRDALVEEAQEFAGIKQRRAACTAAEAALATALATGTSIERLRALTGRLEAAEEAASAALAEAACQAPPSLDRLEELSAAVARLRELAGELEAAEAEEARQNSRASQAKDDEQAAEAALHQALADAGQCPVCGQAVA